MLKNAEKYFDTELVNGEAIFTPKMADILTEPQAMILLHKLQKHRQNTIYLLKQKNEPPERTLAIDIETTGLRPEHGDIRLISLYSDERQLVTTEVTEVAGMLQDANIKKVFHNAAFDVTWLTLKGFPVVNYTDTMIMGQVLHNTTKSSNTLQALAIEYLGIILEKSLQHESNWQTDLTEDHRQYALRDAEVTYQLYGALKRKICEKCLDVVLAREVAALPALVELNLNGIPFDYDAWASVLQDIQNEANGLEREVRQLLNSNDLNLSSPNQLIEAFSLQGLELNSTADENLARYEMEHPAIEHLRKYKKLKKQLSTYGEKLKMQIDSDGRIRGQWRMIGAETSRMTCKQPNLQGLPSIAKNFVKAPKGKKFIVADYSTIELRILAELTKDKELLMAFLNGEDLHTKTAAAILNKLIHEITAAERKIGKVVNFGLVYGMTAYGLQKKIQSATGQVIKLEEAETFRNRYFDLYRSVLYYQDCMLKAECVQTLGGRYWSKETTELDRGAISRFNYPIQATGAEGFKVALAQLSNEKPSKWKLIAAIHDEIVLEVPDSQADEAASMVERVMKQGMSSLIPSVPIEIECKISDHWSK